MVSGELMVGGGLIVDWRIGLVVGEEFCKKWLLDIGV